MYKNRHNDDDDDNDGDQPLRQRSVKMSSKLSPINQQHCTINTDMFICFWYGLWRALWLITLRVTNACVNAK